MRSKKWVVPNWVLVGLAINVVLLVVWIVGLILATDPSAVPESVPGIMYTSAEAYPQQSPEERAKMVYDGIVTTDESVLRRDAAISIAVFLGVEPTEDFLCREGLVTNCALFTSNGEFPLTIGQAAEIFTRIVLGHDYPPPDGDWIAAFEATGFDLRGHTYHASTVTWGDFAAWLYHAAELRPIQTDN